MPPCLNSTAQRLTFSIQKYDAKILMLVANDGVHIHGSLGWYSGSRVIVDSVLRQLSAATLNCNSHYGRESEETGTPPDQGRIFRISGWWSVPADPRS